MIFLYMYCLPSDNCKKLGLVFENVVGIVEIINSKSIQLQVRKTFTECLYKDLLYLNSIINFSFTGQVSTLNHIWNHQMVPHIPVNKLQMLF